MSVISEPYEIIITTLYVYRLKKKANLWSGFDIESRKSASSISRRRVVVSETGVGAPGCKCFVPIVSRAVQKVRRSIFRSTAATREPAYNRASRQHLSAYGLHALPRLNRLNYRVGRAESVARWVKTIVKKRKRKKWKKWKKNRKRNSPAGTPPPPPQCDAYLSVRRLAPTPYCAFCRAKNVTVQ